MKTKIVSTFVYYRLYNWINPKVKYTHKIFTEKIALNSYGIEWGKSQVTYVIVQWELNV